MKSKVEKMTLLDAVFHIAIPKKIIPRISKDLTASLFDILLGLLIIVGTNILTSFVGGDVAQKYFQEWIKNLFSTINSFSLIVPMTVVVIISSLASLTKVFIEFVERKKILPKDEESFDLEGEDKSSK